MRYPLYQNVALKRDIEEHRLRKGVIAVLLDYVPHPSGCEDGCALEIFNAVGESLAVVTVKESDVDPPQADEVLAVRTLTHVGSQ